MMNSPLPQPTPVKPLAQLSADDTLSLPKPTPKPPVVNTPLAPNSPVSPAAPAKSPLPTPAVASMPAPSAASNPVAAPNPTMPKPMPGMSGLTKPTLTGTPTQAPALSQAPVSAPAPMKAPAPTSAPAMPGPNPITNPPTAKPIASNPSAPTMTAPSMTTPPAPVGAPTSPVGMPPAAGMPPVAGMPPRPAGPVPTPVTPASFGSPTAAPTQASTPVPGPTPISAPTGAPTGPKPVAGAPVGAPTTPPPKQAIVKKSPLRFLPFIIGGLVLVGIIVAVAMWLLSRTATEDVTDTTQPKTSGTSQTTKTTPSKTVTLTYWGLWEPSDVMAEVFKEYEQANPGVTIQYTKQSPKDYRERLQTGIASGSGPDLFRFHASWVPMLKNELAPLPTAVMSAAEYQKTFYPVAAKQLASGGQLVGIPLEYDGLALYYNKEILQTAGVQPPTSWSGLQTLARQLTVRSSTGIERGGLAIGTATNVDHFADILALLMLQNGADLANPSSKAAQDALTFYTNFAKSDKVWDETLPNSTVAFARGDVAMMFAPSWRAHEIKALNPNLEYGIAPLPVLAENKMTWASYWAEGVSAQSKSKDEAWKLLKYLSSAEVMKKLYNAQSQARDFGEPYSRVDLATSLSTQPLVAPYLTDAPSAQGWYMSSQTHDNGINDQIIKYWEDAITAVNKNRQPADVLPTVDQGVKQVLRQFGVSTTSPSSAGS